MLESKFAKEFIQDLYELFPGCYIERNSSVQGIPDYTMYWGPFWAKFELKRSRDAKRQPNQPYYIELFNSMSFAAFVCPENKEEILRDLQRAFTKTRRRPRVSKCVEVPLDSVRRGKAHPDVQRAKRDPARNRTS